MKYFPIVRPSLRVELIYNFAHQGGDKRTDDLIFQRKYLRFDRRVKIKMAVYILMILVETHLGDVRKEKIWNEIRDLKIQLQYFVIVAGISR